MYQYIFYKQGYENTKPKYDLMVVVFNVLKTEKTTSKAETHEQSGLQLTYFAVRHSSSPIYIPHC